MVFRKDTKVDAFQRQISALRQQLGPELEHETAPPPAPLRSAPVSQLRDDAYTVPPDRPSRAGTLAPVDPDFAPYEAEDPLPFPPALDARTSVVAVDTMWKGDLQSDHSVHVHGRVEGTVTAKADVFVAEEATVEATVVAENVSVAGFVRGSIRCTGRLEVLAPGRIQGDVAAPVLVVHDGATLNATVAMTAAEAPAAIRRRLVRSGS